MADPMVKMRQELENVVIKFRKEEAKLCTTEAEMFKRLQELKNAVTKLEKKEAEVEKKRVESEERQKEMWRGIDELWEENVLLEKRNQDLVDEIMAMKKGFAEEQEQKLENLENAVRRLRESISNLEKKRDQSKERRKEMMGRKNIDRLLDENKLSSSEERILHQGLVDETMPAMVKGFIEQEDEQINQQARKNIIKKSFFGFLLCLILAFAGGLLLI